MRTRIEFRVERGWNLALVNLILLPRDAGVTARVFPATQMVALVAESAEGVQLLATRRVDTVTMRPDAWLSLGVERLGDRARVILNDEPALDADGVPTDAGAAFAYVGRLAPVEVGIEVAVTLRDFTASTIEEGDPSRSVVRVPRPVMDPRYERILSFIRSDLVADPGTDPQAAERRAIGRAILHMIGETQVNLEVAPPPPESTAARSYAHRRVIYVDEHLMTYTPHVATMLLLPEIVHAHQERAGLPRSCIERELDTAKWEGRLWRAWFGPEGKQPPGDEIEAEFTATVALDNQGRLREAIEGLCGDQCAGQ